MQTLRKDLMVMKKYFLECPKAKESRLLMRLDHFPHFKEGHKRFSMQDLKAVQSGELLQEIHSIHGGFVAHIKKECSVREGGGRGQVGGLLWFLIDRCVLGKGLLVNCASQGMYCIPLIETVVNVPNVAPPFTSE